MGATRWRVVVALGVAVTVAAMATVKLPPLAPYDAPPTRAPVQHGTHLHVSTSVTRFARQRQQQRQRQERERHLRRRQLMYRPGHDKVAGERVWFVQPLTAVSGGHGGGGSAPSSRAVISHPTGVPVEQAHRWCDRVVDNPVVIVGTDGSGTRVVAKFLAMLNVTMMVERSVYSQMDVDGTSAGVHFTNTIQRVLNHTHSTAYELSDLPPALSERTLQVLDPFASSMRRNACAALEIPTAADVAEDEGARGAGGGDASERQSRLWGFKKPDLLNLGPFLTEFFPHVKIVHVVRDGRDMAFSKNQAALHKYADFLYPRQDAGAGLSGRAFQSLSAEEKKVLLWQKQNHDFAAWGERLGPGRYHRVRIEDFAATPSGIQLYSDMAVFASHGYPSGAIQSGDGGSESHGGKEGNAAGALLQRAGEVIGELHGHSLGSHDSAAGKKAVESQFGKWRALANESMAAHLTALANDGLSMFGYL